MHGGKLKRPVTKPQLTTDQIKERLQWSKKWLDKFSSKDPVYYCFLDKKWFYTTSRRKNEDITAGGL